MSTDQARKVIATMSPTMRRAFARVVAGDSDIHGREKASLEHRGLITDDYSTTALGARVHDLILEGES